MSADNGIYILKTKDQCRVIHAQAIDNLRWSYITEEKEVDLVPTRIIEFFGNCKYTRNYETALKIASYMAQDTFILEYGINTICIDKTWKQIVREAKDLAILEIAEILKQNNYETDDWQLKQLSNIINNKY